MIQSYHIHNSNVLIIDNNNSNANSNSRNQSLNTSSSNNNDDSDVDAFLNDSAPDIDEAALIAINGPNCERMNKRLVEELLYQGLVDCIVYLVKILGWYCSCCRSGGVIAFGIRPSQRFKTRAIRDHTESQIYYKYCPEPVKALLDEYKIRNERMPHLLFNYIFARVLCGFTFHLRVV